MEPSKAHTDLARDMLAAYRDEYRDLTESWKGLEAKAQGTVAIAGIFLAAVFAFVRDPDALGSDVLLWGLTVSTALLVIAVASALRAVFLQKIPRPPQGEDVREFVSNILAKGESELPHRLPPFFGDQASRWSGVNEMMAAANERKAWWVRVAQLSLFGAILVFGAIAVSITVPF